MRERVQGSRWFYQRIRPVEKCWLSIECRHDSRRVKQRSPEDGLVEYRPTLVKTPTKQQSDWQWLSARIAAKRLAVT